MMCLCALTGEQTVVLHIALRIARTLPYAIPALESGSKARTAEAGGFHEVRRIDSLLQPVLVGTR